MASAATASCQVPHFYPEPHEFYDNFEGYVATLEADQSVVEAGMVIIHPPPGFHPLAASDTAPDQLSEFRQGIREEHYSPVLEHMKIKRPVSQESVGSKGVYLSVMTEAQSLSVEKFKAHAAEFAKVHNPPPRHAQTLSARERFFWRNLTFRRPTYGADMPGTLFAGNSSGWAPGELPSILKGQAIPGVTMPYLYFGVYGASFAWHTEDADLYAINYIHFGEPKTWWTIPRHAKPAFEALAERLFRFHFDDCKQFLRHKQALISPDLLARYSVPFAHAEHTPGTFALVLPGVYHTGFNHGWNCAESVNFANQRWLDEVAPTAGPPCRCRDDSVAIDLPKLRTLLNPADNDAPVKTDEKHSPPDEAIAVKMEEPREFKENSDLPHLGARADCNPAQQLARPAIAIKNCQKPIVSAIAKSYPTTLMPMAETSTVLPGSRLALGQMAPSMSTNQERGVLSDAPAKQSLPNTAPCMQSRIFRPEPALSQATQPGPPYLPSATKSAQPKKLPDSDLKTIDTVSFNESVSQPASVPSSVADLMATGTNTLDRRVGFDGPQTVIPAKRSLEPKMGIQGHRTSRPDGSRPASLFKATPANAMVVLGFRSDDQSGKAVEVKAPGSTTAAASRLPPVVLVTGSSPDGKRANPTKYVVGD